MHINLTTDYAIRAMLYLASIERGANSAEIADATGVSRNLIINILRKLRGEGLVIAERGVSGGYRLAKPHHEISLMDIMNAMSETVCINRHVDPEAIPKHEQKWHHRHHGHHMREYYQNLQSKIHASLSGMTLERILEGKHHDPALGQ